MHFSSITLILTTAALVALAVGAHLYVEVTRTLADVRSVQASVIQQMDGIRAEAAQLQGRVEASRAEAEQAMQTARDQAERAVRDARAEAQRAVSEALEAMKKTTPFQPWLNR